MPRPCGTGLRLLLADGSGFCDGVFLAHAHRAAASRDDVGLAGHRGTCGGLRALARAPARDLGAGPRLHRHRARGMELRRAGPTDCALRRRHRLSRRGRSGQRRACNSARAHHACVPSRADFELDFRRRAADPARADRQPARAGLLEPVVVATGERALEASLDDLGSATFRADLASMRHETQYTRLFRS